MCFPKDAIEKHSYTIYEKIRSHSVYTPVRLLIAGGQSINIDEQEGPCELDSSGLITEITLQDESGKLYTVEPSENGLKFAKGEINYGEYLNKQKSESRNGVLILLTSISVFPLIGWVLISQLS
ncbi:hypothetical protein [Halobacillus mangrovi]|uniref:hypothetical protein n=1 Tax=Halobacillus mangrovi TaxID=402384 RepID=UPI003D96BABE